MYAEYNEWSVTLYAENRDEYELDLMVCILFSLRERKIVYGSVGVLRLEWRTPEEEIEKGVPEPYIFFPHMSPDELKALLSEMLAAPDLIRFVEVEQEAPDFHLHKRIPASGKETLATV